MDGVLIIDKPAGITSHDVVARVRRILRTKRVGHTGTLDPFATGVLVLLIGRATRLAQFLDKDQKEYEATLRFGFETDTGDRDGKALSLPHVNDDIGATLAVVDWEVVLSSFRGEIDQIPPMYSAKKVGGRKLYELARQGEVVDRKAIKVRIAALEQLSKQRDQGMYTTRLRVDCSAGTYIRTLAEDIGRKIGIGAHLTELRRTRAGKFSVIDSVTLDELAALEDPSMRLIDSDRAVAHLPKLDLNSDRSAKTGNGLSTRVFDVPFTDREFIRMLDHRGELIAIGLYNAEENVVQPQVVLL